MMFGQLKLLKDSTIYFSYGLVATTGYFNFTFQGLHLRHMEQKFIWLDYTGMISKTSLSYKTTNKTTKQTPKSLDSDVLRVFV